MKLEHWRIFAEVADKGSLVEAAKSLGKTPSGVSMSLRQLEQDIGGRLFESDRKTHLTELGQILRDEARQNLLRFDTSVQRIRDHVASQGQTLRLGAVPSAMQRLLPALISAFRDSHPGVHLEIVDLDSQALQEALDTGRLDVVVRSHADPVEQPWVTDRLGWVMRTHHPLHRAAAIDIDQAQAYPLLSNRLVQQARHPELRLLDQQANTRVYNTASLIALLQQDDSLSVLPELAVTGQAGLCFRPLNPVQHRYLKLHYHPQPTRTVQAFVDMAFEPEFAGTDLL